jgi:hypothetical protein
VEKETFWRQWRTSLPARLVILPERDQWYIDAEGVM